MSRRTGLRLVIVLVLAIAVVLVLVSRSSSQPSPDNSSGSDAADGTSALYQYASALGHPTETLNGSFRPGRSIGLLFLFSPASNVSAGDVTRLRDYLRQGGVVVYASTEGNGRLDAAFDVSRLQGESVQDAATAIPPLLPGVSTVGDDQNSTPLAPASRQVPILEYTDGGAMAYQEQVGLGRLIVMSDPLPLCNGYLGDYDNGRFAADLISLAGPHGAVAFDEYHHPALGIASTSPLDGLASAWGLALVWAVLVGFVGLFLRGRAFGPRLELPGAGDRSSVEHVRAVGRLLRRARADDDALRRLGEATRRHLALRNGIAVEQDFDGSLRRRDPVAAEELAAAEREGRERGGEDGLLLAARRLHRLAHPNQPEEDT